jgi:putative FmdB family regulatory protein
MIFVRKPSTPSMSASSMCTPWAAAASRRCSADGMRLDSADMPIYEYRCEACQERFEEFLTTSDKPEPPCPKCGSTEVTRLLSQINTEWLPGDVAWDRVGRSWD